MIGKYIVGRFTKRHEAGGGVHLQKNRHMAAEGSNSKSNQFIYYIYIINENSSFKYIKRKKNEMNGSF